jgi:hypothetical protein
VSHDLEAAWAGSELASKCALDATMFFRVAPDQVYVSTYAAKEGRNQWPHADGVIEVSVTNGASVDVYNLALEYKRPNEGLHGILTSIGQAHAYLNKGYHGAAIVIPNSYSGLANSGEYLKNVLDQTSQSKSIGVFTYSSPDPSKAAPFDGAIEQIRELHLDYASPLAAGKRLGMAQSAQWVHIREGSSDPDAFFRYLQALKYQGRDAPPPFSPAFPGELISAVERLQPGVSPEKWLSNTVRDDIADTAWRYFWFKNILTEKMLQPWELKGGAYIVNHVLSQINKFDGCGYKKFFSGRSDSIKNKIVHQLNTGAISEAQGWEKLAKNFRARAHSYREDIDSGLEYIGFIDSSGGMTSEGYRFMDACEKSSNPNQGLPRALLLSALLQQGGLASFLHYVHKLSEKKFSENPLVFSEERTVGGVKGRYLRSDEYLQWLEDKMVKELRVMRKVSARGGTARKPFQAELAVLRGFGIVGSKNRVGVGLPINWPEVQRSMELL